MKIAILVDNPKRDLSGLVLVGDELARRGHDCYLVSTFHILTEIWRIKPDFVLINYLRENNEKLVSQIFQSGFRVGIAETEGGVFSKIPDGAETNHKSNAPISTDQMTHWEGYALTMASDPAVRDKVDVLCAWSQPFTDYAIRRRWYRQDQVVVTGTPRTDFYSSKWKESSVERGTQVNIPPGQSIILINGSFPLANPQFQTREQEAKMMEEQFGYPRAYVERWLKVQIEGLEGLVEIANQLVERLPEVVFVFRPHPFEGADYYRKHLVDHPNLRLETGGTVADWVMRCYAMIHVGSSTAQEAGMAGVPALSARWLPIRAPIPAIEDISLECRDMEDMVSTLRSIVDGEFVASDEYRQNLEKAIQSTFYKCDGESHLRVADAIEKTLPRCRKRNSKEWYYFLKHGFGLPRGYRWRSPLKEIYQRLKNASSESWANSGKYFNLKMVNRYLHSVRKVSGRSVSEAKQDGYSVRFLGRQTN